MAIETNKSLVQFGYAVNKDASTAAGFITFDSGKQAIYVGDGTEAKLVTPSIKNVEFNNELKVLTITKLNGTTQTLDFSDVASAEGVNSLLATLRTDINKNAADINDVSTRVSNLDASYKAADASLQEAINSKADASTAALKSEVSALSSKFDTSFGDLKDAYETADASLSERIAKFETGDNSVASQISNAIGALNSSKETTDDFGFVTVKVDIVNGKLSENGVEVSTNNIAKASDLNEHINDTSKHVTDDEKEKWNQAAADVSAFLHDASLGDEVINTLTEIQNYITSDASLADQITKNISDVSTAAAAAQATANAAAVKTSVDASLDLKADKSDLKTVTDSYVISFGGAKGAISVDTDNNTNGEVKFIMDASTLKGTVNGLGTAAFTNTVNYATAAQGAKADTAIQGVTAETTELNNTDYVAVHATEDEATHEVTLSSSVKVQDVASAGDNAKGLAEASSVKAYVDSQITAASLTWTVL